MSAEKFNPRQAALNYAAQTEIESERTSIYDLTPNATGAAVNAIACGLVYVGDELRRIADALEEARA